LANLGNPLFFPAYRTHRPHTAGVEYAGWARRFAGLPRRRRQDARSVRSVVESRTPFFFFPLQLDGDTQITRHSPYRNMQEAIEQVLASFALWAPGGTHIIIKNHPLDIGLANYERLITGLARRLDLQGRVHYLESGHLTTLLEPTLGVVTVNSTTGMSGLAHHRPTMTLGQSIYGLPGLTHQGSLDTFWSSPEQPDPALVSAFRNTVIHLTQVNGNLYTKQGIALALRNCARLLEIRSPLEALLG
jgi:capsular polysaccharide export protein